MSRFLARFALSILMLIVSLSLILAGFSNGSAPAAADPSAAAQVAARTEIKIGIMGGITGPGKSAVAPMMNELEATLKYTNEVEGGIDGVKLSWKIIDNKGTPEGAVMAYKELRDSYKPDFYVVIDDYLYAGIKDMIEEDKSVIITTSSFQNTLYVPPGRFFGLAIPAADGFAAYCTWVLADWQKNHPDQTRAPKIGVLYWDMPSGLQWKVAESWVKKQGVEIFPVSYPMTSIDLTTQFMQVRDAGVDYIWMNCITQQAALAIRDFSGLGLKGEISFSFTEMCEAQPLIALVGQNASGFYLYRSEDPSSDGSQAAKLWSDINKWSKGEEQWSDNRINITLKAVVAAAVRQAAADVGADKINNEAIFTALTKLTAIDTWGNMKEFGFSPEKRLGVSYIKMAQFTDTGTVSASEHFALPRVFEGIDK